MMPALTLVLDFMIRSFPGYAGDAGVIALTRADQQTTMIRPALTFVLVVMHSSFRWNGRKTGSKSITPTR